MNILFFIPELSSGGAEKTIGNIITYFKEFYPAYNCYECVMHVDDGMEKPNYLYELEHDSHMAKGKIKKAIFKILQIFDLRRIKKDLNIDVCVSFIVEADIINILSKTDEKVVFSLRNNPQVMMEKRGRIKVILYKHFIKYADYVVTLSKSVEKEAVKIFDIKPERISTIYNPVPTPKNFKEPILIKDLRKMNKKIVVTAGRLTQQKAQWSIIKALSILKKKRTDIVLIILGAGEIKNQLIELANQLEVSQLVYFEGYVNNVYDYLKFSDVFVFPSLFEGLGNVLIEALSVGKTIVSSDCEYGPREILAPGTEIKNLTEPEFAEYGILVPVGENKISSDINKADIILACALEAVLDKDLVKNKYESISLERAKDFDPKEIITQWKTLFDDITTKR